VQSHDKINLYAEELRQSELTQAIENEQQIEQKMMDKSGKLNTMQPKTLFFTPTGEVLAAFLSHVRSQ
jgi:hypothetical protein